jgi:hypothetical protein
MLATRRNCSNRFLGIKVTTVYFDVLTLLRTYRVVGSPELWTSLGGRGRLTYIVRRAAPLISGTTVDFVSSTPTGSHLSSVLAPTPGSSSPNSVPGTTFPLLLFLKLALAFEMDVPFLVNPRKSRRFFLVCINASERRDSAMTEWAVLVVRSRSAGSIDDGSNTSSSESSRYEWDGARACGVGRDGEVEGPAWELDVRGSTMVWMRERLDEVIVKLSLGRVMSIIRDVESWCFVSTERSSLYGIGYWGLLSYSAFFLLSRLTVLGDTGRVQARSQRAGRRD